MPATPEPLEAFLAEPRNVVIATIRKDGRPQMTPVWFYWDGERFYTSMVRASHKYRNLARDPRAQLLFDDFDRGSVLVDCTAELWDDHDLVVPYIRTIRAKYGAAPEDEPAMRERLRREDRVLLVLRPDGPPEQWTSWLDAAE